MLNVLFIYLARSSVVHPNELKLYVPACDSGCMPVSHRQRVYLATSLETPHDKILFSLDNT